MVLEVVETDVQGMVLQGPQDPGILASMAPRSTLELFVARNAGAGQGTWPPVYRGERVSYELEPVAGKSFSLLVRNGIPFPNLFVKTLEFRPVEQESFAGTPHYYLQTTVTAVDGTGDKEFTMVGVVALDLLTRTRLGRLWQPNEYPRRANATDPLPPSYRQF